MSKQIEFFQTEKDEIEFLNMVESSGYLLVDDNGEMLSVEKAINTKQISVFIKMNDSHIAKSKSGYLDAIVSEVIQFSRGYRRDKQIYNGRLWVENRYYDFDGVQKNKKKELFDMYKILEKWIKRNYIKSDCNNFYIGKMAYWQLKENNLCCMSGPRHVVTFS